MYRNIFTSKVLFFVNGVFKSAVLGTKNPTSKFVNSWDSRSFLEFSCKEIMNR